MKNWRIGARLGISIAVLLTLMAIMTAIGIWRLHTVNEVVLDVTGTNLAKERYIGDWFRSIHSGVRRTTAVAKSTAPPLATFFAQDAGASTWYAAEQMKKIEPLYRRPKKNPCGSNTREAEGIPRLVRCC